MNFRERAVRVRPKYLLRDLFQDTQAAGSVNGTLASPGPGVRTVTDGNSVLSIGGGAANFATGGVGSGNPGAWYAAQTRVAGKVLIGKLSVTTASSAQASCGWDNNAGGAISLDNFIFNAGSLLSIRIAGTAITIGAFANATYLVAVVLRAAGSFYFIKGDAFTNWTLVYAGATSGGNPFPAVGVNTGTTTVFSDGKIQIPSSIYLPSPLASDSFNRANGALGNTDGNGHAEQNGGAGLAWTDQVGTWAISSNASIATALSGGIAIATVATTSPDVLLECAVTRAAGVDGLVARYADSSNYLDCYHDGTNAKLDKVVAGVTTNLLSSAAAYSAGAVLRLIVFGTSAFLYYNNVKIGGTATVPASTSVNHGRYTTDTTNSSDNFVAWARGTEGQYGALDDL